MNQRNGYSAQAMPELAVKIRIAPSSSSTTMSGMSHHFFSWRENLKNSLRSDHMGCCEFRFCSAAGKGNHGVHLFIACNWGEVFPLSSMLNTPSPQQNHGD